MFMGWRVATDKRGLGSQILGGHREGGEPPLTGEINEFFRFGGVVAGLPVVTSLRSATTGYF